MSNLAKGLEDIEPNSDEVKIIGALVRGAVLGEHLLGRKKARESLAEKCRGAIVHAFAGDNDIFITIANGAERRLVHVCELPDAYRGNPKLWHGYYVKDGALIEY